MNKFDSFFVYRGFWSHMGKVALVTIIGMAGILLAAHAEAATEGSTFSTSYNAKRICQTDYYTYAGNSRWRCTNLQTPKSYKTDAHGKAPRNYKPTKKNNYNPQLANKLTLGGAIATIIIGAIMVVRKSEKDQRILEQKQKAEIMSLQDRIAALKVEKNSIEAAMEREKASILSKAKKEAEEERDKLLTEVKAEFEALEKAKAAAQIEIAQQEEAAYDRAKETMELAQQQAESTISKAASEAEAIRSAADTFATTIREMAVKSSATLKFD